MLRLYRGLLYLYPAAHRREFAQEMAFVFGQAERDAAARKFGPRLLFRIHEVAGLLCGAFLEHLRHAFDGSDCNLFRRIDMHPQFRFPRSTVFLMIFVLLGVVLAIDKADIMARNGVGLSLWGALWSMFLFLAFVCATVGVIWGVLYATGRSGMHRLANVQTWPERH